MPGTAAGNLRYFFKLKPNKIKNKMTWHIQNNSTLSTSSQGQEEAFSLTCYLVTIQLELAKSNPTQETYSSPDSETESYPPSPSGTMSAHSTENLGEGQLMFCVEDSHAKTSVWRVKEKELPENVRDYGRNMRLIGEMRPRFVFAENSPLLRTRGLGVVLEDLAALGYNARWGIIGAGAVSAPHKRDRMWVLAYTSQQGLEGFNGNSSTEQSEESWIGHAGAKSCNGFWHTDPAEILYTEGEGRGTLRDGEKAEGGVSGINAQHTSERGVPAQNGECKTKPLVGRVVDGVANRVDRLKAIGNGQVPQCAAVAFNILSEGLI